MFFWYLDHISWTYLNVNLTFFKENKFIRESFREIEKENWKKQIIIKFKRIKMFIKIKKFKC